MSQNTWSVVWAADDVDVVRQRLIGIPARQFVRCGGAGAIWHVRGWEELSGDRIGALLTPVEVHMVNPALTPLELPIPSDAS